mgnify:CR=1 FL=1
MSIYQLGDICPDIHETAWIAKDANVIGNVQLGERSSVWFSATIRGDNETIIIGEIAFSRHESRNWNQGSRLLPQ